MNTRIPALPMIGVALTLLVLALWSNAWMATGTSSAAMPALPRPVAATRPRRQVPVITSTPSGCTAAFCQVTTSLPLVQDGAVAWGDYDNDSDLDILITGSSGSGNLSKIYRNDGGGFVDINANLTGVALSSVAWGDYDQDGDLDILLTGEITPSDFTSIVYRNDGPGCGWCFTPTSIVLPEVRDSSVAWGDYDNDGRLDILLTGYQVNAVLVAKVYHNDGQDQFHEDTAAGLRPVSSSAVAWGDYDNDGDLDIVLAGNDGTQRITKLYRNDGNGVFYDTQNSVLSRSGGGSVAWGDYDNDGRLDIAITGTTDGITYIAQIYHNDGNGAFHKTSDLLGVWQGSAVWGDYDNDGDLDILLAGNGGGSTGRISRVYRNDGGTFVDIALGLPGVDYVAIAWGDYDNDSKLDFLLTGSTGSDYLTRLYRNYGSVSNAVPAAPGRLWVTLSGGSQILHWTAGTDDHTPATGLTYNLRVGTTPGGSNVLSPMSSSTGYRRIAALGNVQEDVFWPLEGLTYGQTYYWSVQAIDTAFAGGPFAPEDTFVGGQESVMLPAVMRYRPGPTLTPTPSPTPLCDSYEPNDTAPGWGPLASGQTIQAKLCSSTPVDQDYYYFDTTTSNSLQIDLTIPASLVNTAILWVYYRDLDHPLDCSAVPIPGVYNHITCDISNSGRYLIRLYDTLVADPVNSYTLKVTYR